MGRVSIRCICAMVIILCLTLSAMAAPAQAGTPKSKLTTDIRGYWAESILDQWLDQGWLHGYDDKTVRPDRPISRGEFISLINRSFQYTDKAQISFKDLKPEEWEYDEAQKAVKAGYLLGYPDNTIHVHDTISRQEAAVIIARLLDLKASINTKAANYKDEASMAGWSKEAINLVVDKSIMEGYDDHRFKPGQAITRAEAVVVLNMAKLMSKNASHSGG